MIAKGLSGSWAFPPSMYNTGEDMYVYIIEYTTTTSDSRVS